MFSQPLCSLFVRSYIVVRPSHAVIFSVSCRGAERSCGMWALQETQHPPVEAQMIRDRGGSRETRPDLSFFTYSITPSAHTHTHTPTPFLLFYTPLLVCCALLFPLLLLITYTELNKGARKNVEWIRRRFTSQQGSAGGWGVCSLLPHHLQLGEYSNVSQGFPQCTGDLLRLEM